MKRFGAFVLVALSIAALGCSTMKQFHAMPEADRAAYIAFADKMSVDQRREFLAKGSSDARTAYLRELGLYEDYSQKTAFIRLEDERKRDFLKYYLDASPAEIKRIMSRYDEDTRDRISQKDLQYGWKQEQVILALGKPADILETKNNQGSTNQLWIYEGAERTPTYIYFRNGSLTNWAN